MEKGKKIWKEVEGPLNSDGYIFQDWKEDNILEGVYEGKIIRNDTYGENREYIVIKNGQGDVILVRQTTMLKNKFTIIPEKASVKIEYVGDEKTKDGKYEYRNFKVFTLD